MKKDPRTNGDKNYVANASTVKRECHIGTSAGTYSMNWILARPSNKLVIEFP